MRNKDKMTKQIALLFIVCQQFSINKNAFTPNQALRRLVHGCAAVWECHLKGPYLSPLCKYLAMLLECWVLRVIFFGVPCGRHFYSLSALPTFKRMGGCNA